MIIGSEIIRHEKVSSTNSLAAALLRESTPREGTVITASWQETGKGQPGNSWESEPGKNLLMSVILYPVMVRPADQFIISRMISLAVYDLVSVHTPYVRIKWPNDIYVRNDKIAGILIENSIMGETLGSSVAGIGLNVNQMVFRSDAPNPVSLRQVTGTTYFIPDIMQELLDHLDRRYAMVKRGEGRQLESDYQSVLYRAGEWHRYTDSGGDFEGMIESVKPDGMLFMRKKDGSTREYAFREIDYIL